MAVPSDYWGKTLAVVVTHLDGFKEPGKVRKAKNIFKVIQHRKSDTLL